MPQPSWMQIGGATKELAPQNRGGPVSFSVQRSPFTRIVKRLAVCAALALTLLSASAAVRPADASAQSYTTMNYCFKFYTGFAYNYGVQYQAWFNGRWETIGHGGGTISGCGVFAAPNGYHWRVMAFTSGPNWIYRGFTGYAWAGGGSVNLGTAIVDGTRP